MKSQENGFYTTITRVSGVAIAAMTMLAAGSANAQLPMPTSTQFDMTGFIQEATLDPACATDAHCGGTITLHGHKVTIPKETIVLYPANASTWQEMFALAPAPYGLTAVQANGALGSSGLALNDLPLPLNNYEAHVAGNRVLGGPGGADLYIAGLVYVTSHSLASGSGFINFIDYTLGELRVGGVINDANCAQGGTSATNPLCSGARVRINDPSGRYGRTTTSPDARFSVDAENPTIMAATGFPMCFPRVAPPAFGAAETDPLCPQGQRPQHAVAAGVIAFDAAITMNDPTIPGLAGVPPDANFQAPLEVGDYVSYNGVVEQDSATPTAGPWPLAGAAATYTAAWAVTNNVGIWTAPGTDPAYIMSDALILGTGGLTVIGAGEAVIRTRLEGMTTDTGRNVHLYGIDFNPLTGATSDRDFGTIGVDPGPPNGAVRGRWRFRPPCDPFGTVEAKPEKACVNAPAGTYLPPPREIRAVIEGAWLPNAPAGTVVRLAGNGLTVGQYRNPAIEYIFPENVPGTPIVPNNFDTIPFLAQGGYTSPSGVIPGQLNPWPGDHIPAPACTPATANAGGPYTVAAGGTVALSGIAGGTGPFTIAWAVSSGSVAPANTANTTFSAAGATSPVTATLTVTGQCATATASTTIVVNAVRAPTVAPIAPLSVFSTARGSFTVTGTDPNTPAQSLTFAVTQTSGPALIGLSVSPLSASSATVSFTAPSVTVGAPTVTLAVTARNTGGATSAPATATITLRPIPDLVTVTSVEYRLQKQRLIIQATTSSVDPTVQLFLNPYVTTTGFTFNPDPLGSGPFVDVGGILTLTLVGAPQPAAPPATPITVRSSQGGLSAPSAVTKLR
jgi:hypothetical protein